MYLVIDWDEKDWCVVNDINEVTDILRHNHHVTEVIQISVNLNTTGRDHEEKAGLEKKQPEFPFNQ